MALTSVISRYLAEFARRHGTIRLESAGSGEPFKVLTEDPIDPSWFSTRVLK